MVSKKQLFTTFEIDRELQEMKEDNEYDMLHENKNEKLMNMKSK